MASFDLNTALKQARKGQDLSQIDLVSIDDLTLADIELIFRITEVFKKHVESGAGNKKTDVLKGTSIFNFFNENSTRTRSSFELAGKHLGGDVINIAGSASSGKKGETLGDTARTLDAYNADLLIVRDGRAGVPHQIAPLIGAPVLNAGDGRHEHPTQALLEAFTLREKFGKQKLIYLFVGDAAHSRVFGSQVRLYRKLGYELRLASFQTLIPEQVEKFGIQIFYECETEALKGVDAIHVIRLQTERASGTDIPTPREYSKNFMLNPRRMALANKDAVALHAGPVMREFDIATPVLEGPQSLVQPMVENGLPLRMALEWLLITAKKKKTNPWKK